MWSGGVIDTYDGCDFVKVIFQSRHLNRIIAGLEMFGPFIDLHQKNRKNFITNVIKAIRSFLIHEKKL